MHAFMHACVYGLSLGGGFGSRHNHRCTEGLAFPCAPSSSGLGWMELGLAWLGWTCRGLAWLEFASESDPSSSLDGESGATLVATTAYVRAPRVVVSVRQVPPSSSKTYCSRK